MTAAIELTIRHSMANYIQRWIGTPYKYGGDDFSGFDCSGIIHEVLQAYGLEKRGYDCTANKLFQNLGGKAIDRLPCIGDLAFWIKDRGAIHVEMIVEIIGDHIFTCGASGGGSKTGYQKPEDEARKDAIRDNAYIMRNEINYRRSRYLIVNPFLEALK